MTYYLIFLHFQVLLHITAEPYLQNSNNFGKRVSLDESSPLVPLLHNTNCAVLKKCPDTYSWKTYRKICFGPPPFGHHYHCGITEDEEIVEFFYRKFPCRKGFYGIPKKEGASIYMACKTCPKDRFNPELRWSPENMDQCSSHYHKSADEHALVYTPGNTTDPAVSYCNYEEGWASANGVIFCREAYQPCNCIFKGDYCHLLELLPDGSCTAWCEGKRSPENNFECVSKETPLKEVLTQPQQRPETTTNKTTSNKGPDGDNDLDGLLHDYPSKRNNLSKEILRIVFGILGSVIFLLILVLIYMKREPLINLTKNITTTIVGRDQINITGNNEAHLTISTNDEPQRSEESNLMDPEC